MDFSRKVSVSEVMEELAEILERWKDSASDIADAVQELVDNWEFYAEEYE